MQEEGGIAKGQKEKFGRDVCIHYFDCYEAFMSMCK